MPKESLLKKRERSVLIFDLLSTHYPQITTFLSHDNTFQLLIAVILSAQCTDERVNKVTPDLFKQFPTISALADAPLEHIKHAIRSINFFNNKAKNIKKTAQRLLDTYNSEVPPLLDDLVSLPGVGRKTANVVLGQAFGIPGITVDTHVNRLSRRLGFTTKKDAEGIEHNLMSVWPTDLWIDFSSFLILHGRRVCAARKPACSRCFLSSYCPKKGVSV